MGHSRAAKCVLGLEDCLPSQNSYHSSGQRGEKIKPFSMKVPACSNDGGTALIEANSV